MVAFDERVCDGRESMLKSLLSARGSRRATLLATSDPAECQRKESCHLGNIVHVERGTWRDLAESLQCLKYRYITVQ
jgi:hypothetical protein